MNKFQEILFLIVCCLLCPSKMTATAQQGEMLYMNGKMYKMLSCPLETDSVLKEAIKKVQPIGLETNTSLWRGYIGYWSIKNNTLYLDSLQYETENLGNVTIIPKNEIDFTAYKDEFGVKASWFSGVLRVVNGKLIRYVHMGFERSYKKESFITVKEGVLVDIRKVKNKVICENAIEKQSVIKTLNDTFTKEFPGIKQVAIKLSYSKFNKKGKPTEANVISNDQTENKEKIEQFARSYILKNHILGIYKINDTLFSESYTLRLGEKRNR